MRRPILVVDDDAGLREILELALQSEGHDVLVARDGREALELIEHRNPSLVLLDWMMPRLDGPGLAEEMERRGLRGRVPLLLLTAANGAEERAATIRAEGVLAKPFELPELLDEVDRLARPSACGK